MYLKSDPDIMMMASAIEGRRIERREREKKRVANGGRLKTEVIENKVSLGLPITHRRTRAHAHAQTNRQADI